MVGISMKSLYLYKTARKAVIKKSKKFDRIVKSYLIDEIAPLMSGDNFDNEAQEIAFYTKFNKANSLGSMVYEFEKNNKLINSQQKARKLLKIAKLTSEMFSDVHSRLLITALALDTHRSSLTLSAHAWASIHARNYHQAILDVKELQLYPDYSVDRLKNSIASRLDINDIDSYILNISSNYSDSKGTSYLNETEGMLTILGTLYKKGKDKEIAQIVFDNFKESENIKDVIDFILIDLYRLNKFSEKTTMIVLIQVGKLFDELGKKSFETVFVDEAIKINKNSLSMRSSFWAYQRKGDIKKSKEALVWLEDYAESHNDKKILSFVKSRKKSYLFLTVDDFLELIKEAKDNRLEGYQPNIKNIAYVLHNSLPYASGGYATRGHGLATAIIKAGYDVNIITRPGFPLDTKKELRPSDVVDSQNIDGVEYHTILEPRKDKLPTFEYIQQATEELIEKFKVVKPSLVVGASNHLTALPALIAARKLGIPFVYEVRGFWEITRISREPEFENTEWYKLLCSFEALTAEQADHVFTLTTPMAEELERRGVNKNTITILPNSCNPERFEPTDRDNELATRLSIPPTVPVIGYIGTFVQYEGLEHLAEACGILKQKGLEFRLLIVGNENTAGNDKGPITQKIIDVAVQYGFEDWLIMPGRIPHEEVETYYSLIDIAPFPRKPQPVTEMVSPMKPLEAAAMKKAIVVSSVRALTDMIVDGENGLVFEKGNITDFAEKLSMLISDDYLRIKLGEQARTWVEVERTWEQTANIFCKTTHHLFYKV